MGAIVQISNCRKGSPWLPAMDRYLPPGTPVEIMGYTDTGRALVARVSGPGRARDLEFKWIVPPEALVPLSCSPAPGVRVDSTLPTVM